MHTVPVGHYAPDTTTVIRKAKSGEAMRLLGEHLARSPESFPADTCVYWPFATDTGGYGRVFVDRVLCGVHRLTCEAFHGPADASLVAAHSCDTKRCMNPMHLRWATVAENTADMKAHGTFGTFGAPNRAKTHCPQGHPYDEANTYVHGDRRHCRACGRMASLRWFYERKEAARGSERSDGTAA